TNNKISIPFSNINFWLITLACVVATALIAGSRPAFYLSSFQPVKVLKGAMHVGKAAALPRKILVVLQFSCSVALIISTIIIYQQVQHAKDRPTGFDLNRLVITEMNDDLSKNYSAVKNELIQTGIAENVTAASSPATNIGWHSGVDSWPGKMAGETIEMGTIIVAEDYFKTLGISIAEGRTFQNDNDTNSVVFNEAAIKQMRIKNPVSQNISWDGRQYQIIAVAKDALMTSPFASAEPTMFICYQANPANNLMYRLSPRIKTNDAITQLTTIFNKYNPAYPFDYRFADAEFEKKFKLEVLIGKLSGIFASLAIFISCLGLFGLAAYLAEQRTKEIGIRKVLGASLTEVWLLLSKDFIALVLISCIIASPIALYFLHNWLEKYTYRVSVGAGVFVLATTMAIIITLVTISFQAIKAAIANPVKSLRTE
ncbi:MAG TPA: FtsX-like permease family protein, partial [Segetibacter sp.]|nr:FtsX-like permease family protein [Segetibacter sp.]